MGRTRGPPRSTLTLSIETGDYAIVEKIADRERKSLNYVGRRLIKWGITRYLAMKEEEKAELEEKAKAEVAQVRPPPPPPDVPALP